MTSQAQRSERGCPVLPYTFMPEQEPALSFFARNDSLQAQARPALWTEDGPNGYWVFTDHDAILDGLQSPELFSNSVIVPIDADPPYQWIPIMLDPPAHTVWRQLLASYFSPRRVSSMKDDQRRFAVDLIEGFRDRGSCEFMAEFGQVFPTTIFLQIMGMPTDELDQFMRWEHAILHASLAEDPDQSQRFAAMGEVGQYFAGLLAQRRADHDTDALDIVNNAVGWTIGGEPAPDADVLNCFLLLFMAGLDTVAAQLSYIFTYLATHAEDRRRIVADPSVIPHAVEELLRAFPIVQTARKATRDENFHGCPVKAGDMVAFPLSMAGRDEEVFPDAKTVDLDREDVRHLSFGAGPHRCLGSHLARQELIVVLEEWHRLIPDYELSDPGTEHAGGVYGLERLGLRWTP